MVSLLLALAVTSTASAAPYAVFFEGPPDATPALQRAIDDVRGANTLVAGGDEAGGLRQLRSAAAALARAAADPRTYASNAESPSNATGVIETATAVGDYLDAHGDRRYANIAWRAALRAYDRVYRWRDARERHAVALFAAHRYHDAFAVYAAWARSRGFSASVDDAERAAFVAGLDQAAHGHWVDAEARLRTIMPASSLFPDAAYARGWVLYAQGKRSDARAGWRAASAPSRTGEQPGFSTITVDAVRALLAT